MFLLIPFQESEVVLEDSLMGDGKAQALHTLLHVVHLALDTVLVLQEVFQLQMAEDLEDDLTFLLA